MGVLTERWRVTADIHKTLSTWPPTFNAAEALGGQGVAFAKPPNTVKLHVYYYTRVLGHKAEAESSA